MRYLKIGKVKYDLAKDYTQTKLLTEKFATTEDGKLTDVTADTAAQTSNDDTIATTKFVKEAVSALVNSAPETLDTLKELGDALGNDPNFATTVSTQIGSCAKLSSANTFSAANTFSNDVTMSGTVTLSGTVRLKNSTNYGMKLNFGDGDYVYLHEYEDDKLEIKANTLKLTGAVTLSAALPLASGGTGVTTQADLRGLVKYWGVCPTAAATVAKTVAMSGYSLVTGDLVGITFSNANTAANPTLNINSTGAKAIYAGAQRLTTTALKAGCYIFRYDGTNYTAVVTPTHTRTTTGALDWTANVGTHLVDLNTLSYWNGAYSGTSSNLAYCSKGAFGDLATISKNSSTTQFLRGDGTWQTVPTSDVNMTQTHSTGNANYPVLLKNGTGTGNITSTSLFDADVYVNPSTGSVYAPSFYGTPICYGVCSTAAGTQAKVVSTGAPFRLVTGAMVTVKFSYTNTHASMTLNVNSTGAKAVYYRGYQVVANAIQANGTYSFVYNGTQWDVIGSLLWVE